MSPEQQQLQTAIDAIEAQRPMLGDAMVDMALVPLKARLSALGSVLAPEPIQSLRQVSILFLDVVGSTTLAQHLDPEAISAVMDDALARGTAIVQQHRGKVLQYAGDNILAAFGSDEASEDDAERAVYCGLALLALGRVLGPEVQNAHGHAGFDVRVGIHTGGVLLGGGVDAEGSIRGIAVNIAARMEQTAPAGALRISHDTYAQVRGMFDVDVQEPLTIRGVQAPIQSYLVSRARPRVLRVGSRGIEGVITRMVGREGELEQLQAAFRGLFEHHRLSMVTVVAEAGLGKSRLFDEFEAWTEPRAATVVRLHGRATQQTGAQAYGLLRDIMASHFKIADDDTVDIARRKMERGIVPLFLDSDGYEEAECNSHFLGHLIGLDWRDSRHLRGIVDNPQQFRRRACHVAVQFFRRVGAADGCPVVLQVEDLHWADEETLEFLSSLIEANQNLSLLVLASTRATLLERKVDWLMLAADRHRRIDLNPLDPSSSRMLAQELLKELPGVSAALSDLLVGRAAGNPFYMEELVRMLIDQHAIRTGDSWAVDLEQLLATKVPSTLTGVLQARLDGLPEAEKRALQQASIAGVVFWDQALAAVDKEAVQLLPALIRRELTLPGVDGPLEGLNEFAFRHQVLHQVTYDTVLKRTKRDGHAKMARWLAGLSASGGLRASDFVGLAAEHFEWAGDKAEATEFHVRAAEQAGERCAHERVLAHVDRASALLLGGGKPGSEDHANQLELRWRLVTVRERTLDLLGRRSEQSDDLDAIARFADALDDDRRRAYAARRQGFFASRAGDWLGSELAAHQFLACASRIGDDALRLGALRDLAVARLRQGDIESSRQMAMQALAEARRLDLPQAVGPLLNALAMVASAQDDQLTVIRLARETVEIYRETGNRVNEAITLSNLGDGLLKVGDLKQAKLEIESAIQMLRANGDRNIESSALTKLSTLMLWQGDPAVARDLAHEAVSIAMASKAYSIEVLAGLSLGKAELALGRPKEARQASVRAHSLAIEIASPWQFDVAASLAEVALAEGDIAAALDALRPLVEGVDVDVALHNTEYPRLIELTCHKTLALVRNPHAVDWLVRAHTALTRQAEALSEEPLRTGFLTNIPFHREITAIWENLSAAGELAEFRNARMSSSWRAA